jgi:SAM-dependent methyltransferase
VNTDTTRRAPTSRYLFDNATEHGARHLDLLAQAFDPHTRHVLAGLAPRADAVMLDAGTGAGTIAHFMAGTLLDRGAGHPQVVALDIDPRHVPPHDRITVTAADLSTTDLGSDVYDLIHARHLLMYVPARDEVFDRLVRALKPGGRIVVSDADCTAADNRLTDASPELKAAYAAYQRALVAVGRHDDLLDPDWARYLPSTLRKHGLVGVTASIFARPWTGGQPGLQLHTCISLHLESELTAAGLTRCQLEVLRDGMQDPTVVGYTYPLYTAVGVKPT